MKLLKCIRSFFKKGGVYILTAGFTFIYSVAVFIRHCHFESFAYDLGIYDQAVWLFSQFKFPYSTIKEMIIWGDHFSPSLVLLAPFYWIFDDVRMLLFLQVLVVCFGAVPIFLMGEKYLRNKFLSLVICFGYLVYFGLQNGLLFDFHLAVIYVGLICWLFYFADRKKWFWYFSTLFVFMFFKEDAPIIAFSIGLFIIFKYRNYKAGFLTLVFSGLLFILITRYFIPFFNPAGFHYKVEVPRTLSGFISAVSYPPVKIKTFLISFLPFAFFPVFSGSGLIPIVFHFLEHFPGKDLIGRWDIYLHYRAPLAAFMAVGTILGIENIKKKVKLGKRGDFVFAFLILLATGLVQYVLHLPLNSLLKPAFYYKSEKIEKLNSLVRKIPKDAGVVTLNNIASHLTHRERIYLFPKVEDSEYVLVDISENQPANNFFNGAFYDYRFAKMDLFKLIEREDFKVVEKKDDIYLLKRK